MAQKIIVSKSGYDAVTDTNPDHLVFSSDYNTLKYSLSNGSITLNVDTSNSGEYRVEREITHGLGYRPFFKAYVNPSFLNTAYLPAGMFTFVDSNANGAFSVSVDTQKMYFVVTGRNTDDVIFTPGGGGSSLQGYFDTFFNTYNGLSNQGDTPQNMGQCTGLANLWADETLNLPHIWGHGKDMYANADPNYYDKIANTVDNYPSVGDIVCWNGNVGGGFGHVGVATGNGNANSFQSFDQNWSIAFKCQLEDHNYNHVIGWLRPKGFGEVGGGDSISFQPHHLQYSVTFKYKIFKNKLGI